MEELLLNRQLAGDELNVVNQQRVTLAEPVAEFVHRLVRQTRNHLIREILALGVGDLHVRIVLLHQVDDRVHQVRLAQSAVAVNEERIVIGCGMVCHRKAGGVRKLVRVADDEIVKGVLKAEGRHRLFVLILLPWRWLWHRLAVLVPAVAFGGNLVVAEIAAGVRIVNRCGGHRGDDLILRGRRRAGTAHQLHPDGKTEQTGKLRLNFIEILVLDEIEFEFGVDGQGDEIGGKGLDLNVVEPEIDGGFGKRLPEGFLDQLPDLSDLFYVLKIGHAGKKTPFRQAENSAGLRARNKI